MGVVVPFRPREDDRAHDLRLHIASLDAELAAIPPYEEWDDKSTRERVLALADERHKAAELLASLAP